MIENKQLIERMAAEWVKEFMFNQKEFTVEDIIKAMPLKHLGIDFDKIEFGDKQKEEVWDTVENCIKTYAPRYGYKNNGHNVWKQSNAKPEPSFETCSVDDSIEPEEQDLDSISLTKTEDDEVQDFGLCDPLNNYADKVRALFGADPDVTVLVDNKAKVLNICVAGCNKPDAYRIFFPGTIHIPSIGDITILINGHKKNHTTTINATVLKTMFHNHPLVADMVMTRMAGTDQNRFFVLFKNQTVQYVNDNFGSLYNATTTTPEQLIKDICVDFRYVIWWSTISDLSVAPGIVVKK